MDIEQLREYCVAKPAVTEEFPFGPDTLVFKVGGKMFALTNLEAFPGSFNAKCDPERAIELRGRHPSVKPGWHMNKRHWNTVMFDGTLPAGLYEELLDHSYELVVKSLTRKVRAEFGLT